jgi:hypothetical protein
MDAKKHFLDKVLVLFMWLRALALVFVVLVKFKILFGK